MKRITEHRSETEQAGGKGSTEDRELQTDLKEHSSMSPTSSPVSSVSSPVSPVSSPMSPVTAPGSLASSHMSPESTAVSPLSSTVDQVQTTLPSSPSPKQSGYLHYVKAEIYLLQICLSALNNVKCSLPQIYMYMYSVASRNGG